MKDYKDRWMDPSAPKEIKLTKVDVVETDSVTGEVKDTVYFVVDNPEELTDKEVADAEARAKYMYELKEKWYWKKIDKDELMPYQRVILVLAKAIALAVAVSVIYGAVATYMLLN